MQQYRSNSYLFGGNAPYVEELYEAYLDNPGSVPDNWRAYFDALQHVPAADGTDARDVAHAPVVESFAQRAKANAFGNKASSDRPRGRPQAGPRPVADRRLPLPRLALGRPRPAEAPGAPEDPRAGAGVLRPDRSRHGHRVQRHEHLLPTAEHMTLREIVQALRETYCGSIGAEYMYITDPAEKRWWQERLEIDPLASRASAPRRRSTSSTA